jgi:transcriptional regulator with XRE-family HTH domain
MTRIGAALTGKLTPRDRVLLKTVGENVRRARLMREWTQLRLAEVLKVKVSYLSEVEKGKRNLTLRVLGRLARALRTTEAALVTAPTRRRDRRRLNIPHV